MMKKTLVTMIGLSTMTGLAYAQDFTLDFEATKPKLVEGNAIVFDGLRVEGFGLMAENDAVRLKYVFNPETFNFELNLETGVAVYPGVGVFHEEHLVIDVDPLQPAYTANVKTKNSKNKEVQAGEPLNADSDTYLFTAVPGTPFVADFDLQIGHVMSFYFSKAKTDIVYQFIGPKTVVEGEIKAKDRVLLPPIKILMAGVYQLRVEPSNPEDKLTFSLKSFNANNRALEVLTNGQSLKKLKFEENAWDYAKFQVTLNAGETLEVPASKNVAMKLVKKNSHVATAVEGGNALSYPATEAGDYYLFLYSELFNGKYSYTGEVLILAESEPGTEPDTTNEPQPTPGADETEPTLDGTEPLPAPDVDETETNVDEL